MSKPTTERKGISKALRRFYGVGDFGFTLMTNVESYYFQGFLTNLALFSTSTAGSVSQLRQDSTLKFNPSLPRSMVKVEFAAGAEGAPHCHPHSQSSLIERGRFRVTIGGVAETLEAGDGFFVPSGVEHGVVALEAGTIVDVFAPAREDFL